MQDDIVNLISKHLRHTDSDEEKAQLLQWLEQSEENRRFYSLFSANYSLHETLTSPDLNGDIDAMLNRLDARIEASEPVRRPVSLWKGAALAFSFAAVIALAFILPWRRQATVQEAPVPQMELCYNPSDATSRIVLDDGTNVYLGPGASMRYNVSSLQASREVELDGEAYFDVTRDEAKPFLVRTSSISIKVLGTAFSVSSDTETAQVVLERGSVRIISPEGHPMVSLTPNQKATFKAFTGDIRVEPVYATAFVTDKYNLVSMHDVTVDEILAQLSRLFGVKISCKGVSENKRYNLAFLKSDSMEDVLSIVEYLTGAECTFTNKQ